MNNSYREFIDSGDSIWIYNNSTLVYTSPEKMLLPLIKYLQQHASIYRKVTVFDKIVGNAAALLLVLADCAKVFSPLGSEVAIKTLSSYGIDYEFTSIVPFIQKANTEEMCPMEKLSAGKNPKELFLLLTGTDWKS